MRRGLLLPAGAVLAVAAGTLAWTMANDSGRADPEDAVQVARGEAIYAEYCASCHGARLEGQPDWRSRKPDGRMPAPPHDASGHTWHHPDGVLFEITKKGIAAFVPPGYQSDMPSFQDVLTDEEIWAALAFIKSTWPTEVQARQAAITQQAAN